jgi:Cys-tRNA(Pro)/Cys-tRNA(Cys) deacylase
MIPSDLRLNLKRMAVAAGVKKVRMAAHKDAESLTGLKVGGISAVALIAKGWPVFLDSTAAGLQHIVISAGQRGLQLQVPVTPLISLLKARMADVSEPGDD